MNGLAINLDKISLAYDDNQVLRELSLKVKSGEHIGILGDSGCGKSTLLKVIAGLYVPDKGKICVMGEDNPEKIRKYMALVM